MAYKSYVLTTTEVAPWAPEGDCPRSHPYLTTNNSVMPGKLCWDAAQGFDGGGECQDWCLLPQYVVENPGRRLDACPENICAATFRPLPAPEGDCPSDHPYLQTPHSVVPGKLCWDNAHGFDSSAGPCQNWCLLPQYATANPGGHLDACPDNVCHVRAATQPPPLDERGESGGSDDADGQNTGGEEATPSSAATTAAVILSVTVLG